MGEQNGGPTLEGLAQRLETLTEKLGGLERENEVLRKGLAVLSEPGTRRSRDGEPGSKLARVMSRRSLLSKTGGKLH
jgi:hypothetical protein